MKENNIWHIVKGVDKNGKIGIYAKNVKLNEIIYYNVRIKTYKIGIKYGSYNRIIREPSKATFYNCGKEVKIKELSILENDIDRRNVAKGYNF